MRRKILIVLALLAGAVPMLAIPVSGRVRVSGRAAGTVSPTVVYAQPLDGTPAVQPRRATLKQINKSFQPRVVVVPTGSTIEFPNADPIFHNVFSLSPPQQFDLGLYRSGASKSQVFKEPAVYRVFCNIHPQMAAVILVVPTSYIAEVDAAGNYKLDLPAGRYRVTAWSERADPVSVEATISAAAAALPDLTLDETKPVSTVHTNKFGQEYPKTSH